MLETQEIKDCEVDSMLTKRSVSEDLENLLQKEIKVLDNGFIRVIDYMGDDSAVVQAARVSYGKGTKKVNNDKALINYLMRNEHTSPFEMCEIKFHVKLPIFVARQWIRHRTANVNEYSARYSILKSEFYFPEICDVCEQSADNKQSRGTTVDESYAAKIIDMIKQDSLRLYDHYQLMLNIDESGNIVDQSRPSIAREISRIMLPLNTYTEFYWKIDLHNLLRFIKLRISEHAQLEIRKYAYAIADIIKAWMPYTYEAFENHVLKSHVVSDECMKVLKKLVNKEEVNYSDYSIGRSEWNDLMNKIGRLDKIL